MSTQNEALTALFTAQAKVIAATAKLAAGLATEIAAPGFTECDWDLYDGDVLTEGEKFDAYQAEVASAARECVEAARMALDALKRGDVEEAEQYAGDCASAERQFGDAPCWGFAQDGIERLIAANEERDEAEAELASFS